MATWAQVETVAPGLAAAVRKSFDAHKHKTMASLRLDGSPRISGTEANFEDGELLIGSMVGARKAADLLRDPRVAIHSSTADETMALGDAKVAGLAVPVEVAGASFHQFRLDVAEVSIVRIAESGDHLVIESWTEGRGYESTDR